MELDIVQHAKCCRMGDWNQCILQQNKDTKNTLPRGNSTLGSRKLVEIIKTGVNTSTMILDLGSPFRGINFHFRLIHYSPSKKANEKNTTLAKPGKKNPQEKSTHDTIKNLTWAKNAHDVHFEVNLFPSTLVLLLPIPIFWRQIEIRLLIFSLNSSRLEFHKM